MKFCNMSSSAEVGVTEDMQIESTPELSSNQVESSVGNQPRPNTTKTEITGMYIETSMYLRGLSYTWL